MLGITLTIFGDPTLFSVEVALEPQSSVRFMGGEPLGRMRVWIDGKPFGCWTEPSCPFGGLLEELRTVGNSKYFAWHQSLEFKIPIERFQILDDLIFAPDHADRIYTSLDNSSFLTNAVECLDGVKGFALTPPGDFVQILASDQAAVFAETLIDKAALSSIAAQLGTWVQANRRDA